jgi:hypothetical protein
VWAQEFCRIFNGHTIVPQERQAEFEMTPIVDEGTMIGWFGNAMATALNLAKAETVDLDLYAPESPPDEDEDDDDDGPTPLEEQFREGFYEGRPPTA